ncbi:transposase [Streptomyces sp. NPDC087263]|uniref:transposase n=1 Tax=Streptomyces sp. NPDC087263 TaxID=3365773 RepID=UPI003807C2C1
MEVSTVCQIDSAAVPAEGATHDTTRRYPEEIRGDAVALVHSSGKSVIDVARKIGVSTEWLRNRIRQGTVDRGQGAQDG